SIEVQRNNPDAALGWLSGNLLPNPTALESAARYQFHRIRAAAWVQTGNFADSVTELIRLGPLLSEEEKQVNQNDIWITLQKVADANLATLAQDSDSYELRGWVELARAVRAEPYNIRSQLDAVGRWRERWTQHTAAITLPDAITTLQIAWDNRAGHIALLLPASEPVGNAIQEGFVSAYYQALGEQEGAPRITVFDTAGVTDITPLYEEAIAVGADVVIGPFNKELVQQLQQLRRLPVPTLALNYLDNRARVPENLYQFGLAPEDEISQVVDMAWRAGHRNVAILTPQNSDYLRLQDTFASEWEARGGIVVARGAFNGDNEYPEIVQRLMNIDASQARASRLTRVLPRSEIEFIPRRREDIDFIFLMVSNPQQGRQIKPTLAFYFAGDVPVYAMPTINDGVTNPTANGDLDGIIFTDAPWVLPPDDPLKQLVNQTLRPSAGVFQRLRALGVDAFRIYPLLEQMADGEIAVLPGSTGNLSMRYQAIRRELQSAVFVDGLATVNEGFPGGGLN
ncbi:MAG: penicillin-binding protein activator, partial [Pseudohongiellaceae bacterium]